MPMLFPFPYGKLQCHKYQCLLIYVYVYIHVIYAVIFVIRRLFGLTAIIRTDCDYPTRLLLHSDLEYPVFVNPVLLLILSWLLTTDLRLWINTPVR